MLVPNVLILEMKFRMIYACKVEMCVKSEGDILFGCSSRYECLLQFIMFLYCFNICQLPCLRKNEYCTHVEGVVWVCV